MLTNATKPLKRNIHFYKYKVIEPSTHTYMASLNPSLFHKDIKPAFADIITYTLYHKPQTTLSHFHNDHTLYM